MVWKGRIVKDGPEVHLTGTSAQDIHAQIMAINPSYEPEHPIGATSAVPLPLSARDGGKSIFERQGATVSCHGIEKGLDSEIRVRRVPDPSPGAPIPFPFCLFSPRALCFLSRWLSRDFLLKWCLGPWRESRGRMGGRFCLTLALLLINMESRELFTT